MNALLESRCKRLLMRYKRTGVLSIRDKLFEQCSGYLIRFVKICLKRYKRYESQSQVMSLAYITFEVMVDSYTTELEIDLTMHISNCAKAEVRKWVKKETKKKKMTVSLDDDCVDIESIQDLYVNPFYAIEGYMSLKEFRQFLPDMYRVVLDDAIMSFDSARKYRKTRPINCPISAHRYYEAKRVMQFVAEFFLRG